MSSFHELIPGDRGDQLASILLRAAATSHAENGLRFDAEELGDGNRQYGDLTANTARHLAGRMVEDADLPGVTVHSTGLIWWLDIERGNDPSATIYFYKAPPDGRTAWALEFDSDVKRRFSKSNSLQMSIFDLEEPQGEPLNLVAVHYGNPHDGFSGLDIGAPYVDVDGSIKWAWTQQIDAAGDADTQNAQHPDLGDDGAGFDGLRIVEPPTEDDEALPTGGDAIDGLDISGGEDSHEEEAPPAEEAQ